MFSCAFNVLYIFEIDNNFRFHFFTPFFGFHLRFPSFHLVFLSTYRFLLLRSSLQADIRFGSSLPSIPVLRKFYPGFASTFFLIFVSKPAVVCSIFYIFFSVVHSSARGDHIHRVSDLRTPRNISHLFFLSPQFRFEFPSIFHRLGTSTLRSSAPHSLHYVYIPIRTADRYSENTRILGGTRTERSPADTVTAQLADHCHR